MDYLFTIHPYVDITITPMGALLFNTFTSRCYEIKNSKNIELLRQLTEIRNNSWVIELTQIEIQDNIQFLSFIKENFLGSYFQPEKQSTKKPIQVYPQLKIKTEIELYDSIYEFSIGEKILSYLDELTIYITNASESRSYFANGYKQFIYPIVNDSLHVIELSLPQVQSIFNQIENSKLSNINLLGGSILKYSHYSSLIEILQNVKFNLSSHFLLEDLLISDIFKIKELKTADPHIIIHISPSNDIRSIRNLIDQLTSFNFNFSFNMIVRNETDIEYANKLNKFEPSLTPYFTGSNFSFFSKYVFLTKKDIHSVKLSQIEVMANSKINNTNFGKIQIQCNGNIYANINHLSLGNISNMNIKEAIVKELREGNSWLNVRNKVEPCKQCFYNKICPSISNYEHVIERNNLCNIKNMRK